MSEVPQHDGIVSESALEESTGTPRPNRVQLPVAARLFDCDPVSYCQLLGIEVVGRPVLLPAVVPPVTLSGDILLIRAAPRRIEHVEFMHSPVPERHVLKRWMGQQHHRVMSAYPWNEIRQHVVSLVDDSQAIRDAIAS